MSMVRQRAEQKGDAGASAGAAASQTGHLAEGLMGVSLIVPDRTRADSTPMPVGPARPARRSRRA